MENYFMVLLAIIMTALALGCVFMIYLMIKWAFEQ